MYKLCDRCRFHVPSKNNLCNVCGSQSFSELNGSGTKSKAIKSALPVQQAPPPSHDSVSQLSSNVSDTLGAISARIGSSLAEYGRELLESGVKAKSAAIKMKNLIAMPTASHVSHDDVLSFHKNISFGRRFKPVAIEESSVSSLAYAEKAPVSASVSASAFTPMIVKPLDQFELERALNADVATIKHNLDELKVWFETYGKDDALINAQAAQMARGERERHAA